MIINKITKTEFIIAIKPMVDPLQNSGLPIRELYPKIRDN